MQLLLIVLAILLILTKLLDALTTLKFLNHPAQEQNGLFRQLMQKWGPEKAILLNLLLAQLIIGLFFWELFQASVLTQLLALPLILAVILIQGAVALANAKQQSNLISRQIHRLYTWLW